MIALIIIAAAAITFRNEQVAAPLKDLRLYGVDRRIVAFRNEQVAAPLKDPRHDQCGLRSCRIPQRTSCGPIEGGWFTSATSFMASFRNEQVAAPLKEVCGMHADHQEEAFRNEQVAAPLKDRIRIDIERLADPFRNEQVAAPLKVVHAVCGKGRSKHSATNKLRPH